MLKRFVTNKRNKGGHYILTMLPSLALSFQMIAAMLHRLELMLHVSNSGLN